MRLFRRLLIGAALAMGFVGTISYPTPAVAVKQRPYNTAILRYEEFYRQQLRFFIFQGAFISDKISDPIARQGSFLATFLNGDADPTNDIVYLVEVRNLRVRVTLQ